MVIHYTTIVRTRFDAPYVGTLIAGPACTGDCPDCFNQHLKSLPIREIESDELLDSIYDDPFSEGIILSGLEWLDSSYDEVLALISGCMDRGLKVILYTRRTEEVVRRDYPELFQYKGLYIKVGAYDPSKKVHGYMSHGVLLATSNQYIIEVS